jgi:hypothetical protein
MGLQTDESIICMLDERRKDRAPMIRKAERISEIYHDEVVLPAPSVEQPSDVPTIVNLFSMGIDGIGQRIASTIPTPRFSDVFGSNESRKDAGRRRDTVLSWWEADHLELKLGKMGRWWAAWASVVIDVRPLLRDSRPEYMVRNPLTSFPSGDEVQCEDAVFVYRQSRRWCEERWPDQIGRLSRGMSGGLPRDDGEIEMIEYVSAEERVLLARYLPNSRDFVAGPNDYVRLVATQHDLGVCPVAAIGRPGLVRPAGQFDGMVGAYFQQAMLQSLEVMGTKRTVFPTVWFVAPDGVTPNIVQDPNPEEGVPGIISGGSVQVIAPQGGFQANTTIDRLERNQRAGGRIPAEFAGEASSNIRTGRRGDQVLASTIDFPVMEGQRHFARLLEQANKAAIATDRFFYRGRTKTVAVNWQGSRDRKVTYDPGVMWSSDAHTVTYAHPGSDTNTLAIGIIQRVGAGMMSKRTGMEMDPMIDDAEFEHDQTLYEQLEMASLQTLQAQAQQGAIPPADLARIAQLVQSDQMELWDAIQTAQREAQERQAAAAPPGAPETQPGLGPPGQGAEQPAVGALPAGVHNALANLTQLRMPYRLSPQEANQSPVPVPATTAAERGA